MADWLGLRRAQAKRDEMAEEPKEAASAPAKGTMSQADFFKKPEETAEQKAAKAKKLAELLRK